MKPKGLKGLGPKLKELGFNNYKQYLKSEHWKRFTNICYYHKEHECSVCNQKKGNLYLHHLNYKNLGEEELSDVAFLCYDCHMKTPYPTKFRDKKRSSKKKKNSLAKKKENNNKKPKLKSYSKKKKTPSKSVYLPKVLSRLGYEDYKDYLTSGYWQYIKSECKAKKKYCCFVCGSSEDRLHLHHTTYKNIGKEVLKDLVYLCEKCHSDVHKAVKSKTNPSTLENAHLNLKESMQNEKPLDSKHILRKP